MPVFQREREWAKIQVMAKRELEEYGYSPDKQENATETVLEQVKLIARDWAEKAA